jgi:hypothetical protein
MKKLFAILALAALLVGGWYFASPWITLSGLEQAALDVDLVELEQRVDFDAVRTSLKDELHQRVADATADSGTAVRVLGGALVNGLTDMAIDSAVTPTGVAGLVSTGKLAAPLAPRSEREGKLEWSVAHRGFTEFDAASRFADGSAGPILRFARDGLAWKLVAIELPDSGR